MNDTNHSACVLNEIFPNSKPPPSKMNGNPNFQVMPKRIMCHPLKTEMNTI